MKFLTKYWLAIFKVSTAVLGTNWWRYFFYASDVDKHTIIDNDCEYWNFNTMGKNISKRNIPGVTSAYTYYGSIGGSFNWHTEDSDLYSLNYIYHEGCYLPNSLVRLALVWTARITNENPTLIFSDFIWAMRLQNFLCETI